jgi:hypothetical protein
MKDKAGLKTFNGDLKDAPEKNIKTKKDVIALKSDLK